MDVLFGRRLLAIDTASDMLKIDTRTICVYYS